MATETAKLNLDGRGFLQTIKKASEALRGYRGDLDDVEEGAKDTAKALKRMGDTAEKAGGGGGSIGLSALTGGVAGLAAELAGSLAENIKAAVERMSTLGEGGETIGAKMEEIQQRIDGVLVTLQPVFERLLDFTLNVIDAAGQLFDKLDSGGSTLDYVRSLAEGVGIEFEVVEELVGQAAETFGLLVDVLGNVGIILGSVYARIVQLATKALGPLFNMLAKIYKVGLAFFADGLQVVKDVTDDVIKSNEDLAATEAAVSGALSKAGEFAEGLGKKREVQAKKTDEARGSTDGLGAALLREAEAAREAQAALDGYIAKMAAATLGASSLAVETSGLSEETAGALPEIENLGEQLDGIDTSGLKTAQTLSTIKDVAAEVFEQLKRVAEASLEVALNFSALATDTALKALSFDIGGILDTFAEAIPAALDKVRAFGSAVLKVLREQLGELPAWVEEAGAAVGAALAFIGAAAGAAIKVVSGVVGAVNQLLQQFAGVDIVGLLTGDMDPASLFRQAEAALASLLESLPRRIGAVFSSGALGDFFKSALDGLVDILPTALPAVVDFLVAAATDLIKALPAILTALINSDLGRLIRDVLLALADQLPTLIPQLIEIGAQIMVGVIEALPELIVAIIKALPAIAVGLIKAIGQLILGLIAGILRALGLDRPADAVSGLVDSSFNDTPGIVKAAEDYRRFAFAPGDYVAAAKTPDALRRQVDAFDDSGMVGELRRHGRQRGQVISVLGRIADGISGGGQRAAIPITAAYGY